jgi:hypothetical protein
MSLPPLPEQPSGQPPWEQQHPELYPAQPPPYQTRQEFTGQPTAGYPPQQRYYPPDPQFAPAPRYRQPPPGWQPPPARPQRKKRRVFLWVFLAIQALFILWLVAGLATTHTGPTQAQLASACYHHNWWPLYKSQANCVTHFGALMNDAGNTGKALGAGLIVLLWVVVDIILGISYGVYRLATRDRR